MRRAAGDSGWWTERERRLIATKNEFNNQNHFNLIDLTDVKTTVEVGTGYPD